MSNKHFIPCCMGTAVHQDKDFCTCERTKKSNPIDSIRKELLLKIEKYEAAIHRYQVGAESIKDGRGMQIIDASLNMLKEMRDDLKTIYSKL